MLSPAQISISPPFLLMIVPNVSIAAETFLRKALEILFAVVQ
jgi:hypothetical protein